jgi:hypothetical protein|nr:MAG TPA: transmembrane protein [Caudoviricetes sp.]
MKKIIKFLIELLIFSFVFLGILMIVGIIRNILERLPLLILIIGLFLTMIIVTILEYGGEIDEFKK